MSERGSRREGVVTEVGSRSVRVWVEDDDAQPGSGDAATSSGATDDRSASAAGHELRCTLRGNLWNEERDESRPVAVGDRVDVLVEGPDDGVVEAVHERSNRLARPQPAGRDGSRAGARGKGRGGRTNLRQVVAANLDRLVIVTALVDPPFRAGLVDRFLVKADMEGIDPVVVVNKVDLEPDGVELAAALLEPYAGEGVPLFVTSAETGLGIDALRAEMSEGISLLVGHSGVGKSSLLNAVSPGLRLGVGRVTDHHGRGRHTTTRVSLKRLAAGGWVVDTPGIREFGLDDIPAAELARLYPGFGTLPDACRFNDCLHRDEPDCAVVAALESDELDPERYEGYRRILEEVEGGG